MTTNKTTLADLSRMTNGELCAVPVDHIPMIQDDVAALNVAYERANAELQRLFYVRYADTAEGQREGDTGTVWLDDGDWTVRCEVRKRVVWDQDKLEAILDEIERGGGKAEDYATFKAYVPEKDFCRWPKPIREQFGVARKVIGSTPFYQMRRK